MASKPKLRLIVEMHGGTIQTIYADNPDVEITDIVFTEYAKYGTEEPEFPVDDTVLGDAIIYTHHAGVTVAGDELFEPVMVAAEARANHEDE